MIYATPRGKKIIDRMMASTYEFKISGDYSGSGGKGFNNLTNNIKYSQVGVGASPSYVVLAHELGHENDWLNYIKSNKKEDWVWNNWQEYKRQGHRSSESTAMLFENYIYLIYGGSYYNQRITHPKVDGLVITDLSKASHPIHGLQIEPNSVSIQFQNHEDQNGQPIFSELLIQYQKGNGSLYENYIDIIGKGYHKSNEKKIDLKSKNSQQVGSKTIRA